MSSGEELLAIARIDTYNNSKTLAHKIATSVWYKARKKVLHAPRVAAPALMGKAAGIIPVIGDAASKVASMASEKIIEAVLQKQMHDKQGSYRSAIDKGITEREALRKNAKWEAKSVKQVIEKLESNQVKLRDAASTVSRRVTTFMSNPTDEAAVVGALMAVCEEERYINKLALLSAWAQAALQQIDAYISEARIANLQAQKFIVDGMDAHTEKGFQTNPLYQAPNAPGRAPAPPLIRPTIGNRR